MQVSSQVRTKKVWATPRLTIHGNVAKITQDKKFGWTDAYLQTDDINNDGVPDGSIGEAGKNGTKGWIDVSTPSFS